MNRNTNKYRPSNGTEGSCFYEKFCENCVHESQEDECEIVTATMLYEVDEPEYPEEWTYDASGKPTCTKFLSRGGDSGGQDEPVPVNQLSLFPLEVTSEMRQESLVTY